MSQTLQSLVSQTFLPAKVVLVDDNSTDETAEIAQDFADKYDFIKLLKIQSSAVHLPGSKVIRAFQAGFETLDNNFDIILKLDADIILPNNYLERIAETFAADQKVGMAGGFAYIEKDGNWIKETLTDNDHIRGAFKAYRKTAFEQIGGLKPAMGWDTVDELLMRFYDWKIITIPELHAKHLKPTGANYDKTARYKQGQAFYALGYGFWITAIASLKLSMMKKKPLLFLDYIRGFFMAKKQNAQMLVTPEQGKFVREFRWNKIKQKIGF